MPDPVAPDQTISLVERLRIIADDEGVAQLLVSQTDIERDCAAAAARIEQLEAALRGLSIAERELNAVAQQRYTDEQERYRAIEPFANQKMRAWQIADSVLETEPQA